MQVTTAAHFPVPQPQRHAVVHIYLGADEFDGANKERRTLVWLSVSPHHTPFPLLNLADACMSAYQYWARR